MRVFLEEGDELYLRLSASQEILEQAQQALTVMDKGDWKRYQDAVAEGQPAEMPQATCMFDIETGRFFRGHLPLLRNALYEHIEDDKTFFRDPLDQLLVTATSSGVSKIIPGVEYRDYQESAIMMAKMMRIGIIKLATASGKTLIAAGLIKTVDKSSLFLVNQIPLLHQTIHDFRKYGFSSLGMIGDGVVSIGKVTIAYTPYLAKLVTRGDANVMKMLRGVDVVVCDEAHHAAASSWLTVFTNSKQAKWRIGLSATPFENLSGEPSIRDLFTFGIFRQVIYEIDTKTMVDNGHLARPSIYMIPINDRINVPEPRARFQNARAQHFSRVFKQGITLNRERNQKAQQIIYTLAKKNKIPTLVLVSHIQHGVDLIESLRKLGISAAFITGQKQVYLQGFKEPIRDEIVEFKSNTVNRFANNEFDVLVGSPVIGEGYDLPNDMVGALVLLSGGKGTIAVLQRIGRALRPKKSGSNTVVVVDFFDHQHYYLEHHSRARQGLYREEGHQVLGWDDFRNDFLLEKS